MLTCEGIMRTAAFLSVLLLLLLLLLDPAAEAGQVEATSAEAAGDAENSITDGLATHRRRCRR